MTPFVILSSGRSGSTLLCHALNEHPDVTMYHEVFHWDANGRARIGDRVWDASEDPIEFCEKVIWGPDAPRGAVGFKIFYHQCRDNQQQAAIWRYLRDATHIPKIILERENLFDLCVSHFRAEKTGLWQPLDSMEETRAAYDGAPIWIDALKAKQAMDDMAAGMVWLKSAFPDHLLVTYDEMRRDLNEVANRIFQRLGVAPMQVSAAFSEMHTSSHEQGLGNWPRVKEYISTTIYADHLPS